MASKYGLTAFTVQEATNGATYYTYKSENLTLNGTAAQTTSSWTNQPAKEVVIFSPGAAANDDGITISLKVNGAHGDDIIIHSENLPFTVKGLLIEEVIIHGDTSTTQDDYLTVLSFH